MPHPLVIRLTHWLNALAVIILMMSGWTIYNASPILPFSFPGWMLLGGWLGGALALHFAAMWLLVGSTLVMLGYGLLSGHLRRRMLPLRLRDILRDLSLALRLSLRHEPGTYNAVQRLAYVTALSAMILLIGSGLAIWKPVQLGTLTELLGGFEIARIVHFGAMSIIAGFLLVHLVLVLLVPRTLWSMLFGGAIQPSMGAPK
jgi:thiosulfate reductase cytochrome b subunit